jgi:hypothetical protein
MEDCVRRGYTASGFQGNLRKLAKSWQPFFDIGASDMAETSIEWTDATWNPGRGLHRSDRRLHELLRHADGRPARCYGSRQISRTDAP